MAIISIVLPTYNGQKYIRESIDSVLRQSFTDWELIIVDDCSTDDTPQIAEQYAAKDSRIHVIHNSTNQKLPNSLNIGFANSEGEYLTWTSDDNKYLPSALMNMYTYLVSDENAYMVCADVAVMNGQGIITGHLATYNQDSMYYNNVVGACFLYRKKVLEELGGYDSSMFLVEDYDYWMRILIKYGKIGHINQTLYLYRMHNESLSTTREKEIHDQLLCLRKKYIRNIIGYYKDKPEFLCRIYLDFIVADEDISDYKGLFTQMIPELGMIVPLIDKQKVIIYGAGAFGNKAYQSLQDKAAYYADGNPKKVGKKMNGLEILSVDAMLSHRHEYQILVAVSREYAYELLHILWTNGIRKSSLYFEKI